MLIYSILALITGLLLLIWSADRFVEGASDTAQYFGMPKILIGVIIIGFGTSAPEIVVSAISALNHNPGLALGNAYGSNIANIALILGLTALLSPVAISRSILKKELPILFVVTLISAGLLYNGYISRLDGIILLSLLAIIIIWTIFSAIKDKNNELVHSVDETLVHSPNEISITSSLFWVIIGLTVLLCSSQLLVWGAVNIAHYFGVSDLIIGLTVVAIGTSLPELASSIAAARKGHDELVLGNIVGSNLFNTLAVVGLAAVISPMDVSRTVLTQNIPIMLGLTASIFFIGLKHGVIKRYVGVIYLIIYALFTYTLFIPHI